MSRLAPILYIALAACGSQNVETERAVEEPGFGENLSGELPAKVILSCEDNRQYRIFFSDGIWDWKTFGGWSSYIGIAEITEKEILLRSGNVTARHGSLVLDRYTLNLVQHPWIPDYGMTVEPRPAHFACVIAETESA